MKQRMTSTTMVDSFSTIYLGDYSSELRHYRKTLPPDVFQFGPLPNGHITLENHCD